MRSSVPDVKTPEIILPNLNMIGSHFSAVIGHEMYLVPGIVSSHIIIVNNSSNIIMNKVPGEIVAEDDKRQCYQHHSMQAGAGQQTWETWKMETLGDWICSS